MIVLKKGSSTSAPMNDINKAQEMMLDGWEVYINKTGTKLVAGKKEEKKEEKKEVKKTKKKK